MPTTSRPSSSRLAGDGGDRLERAEPGDAGAREDQRPRQLAQPQRQEQDDEEGDEAAADQQVARRRGAPGGKAQRSRSARASAVRTCSAAASANSSGRAEVQDVRPQQDLARGEPQQHHGADARGGPQQGATARRGAGSIAPALYGGRGPRRAAGASAVSQGGDLRARAADEKRTAARQRDLRIAADTKRTPAAGRASMSARTCLL